MGTCATSKGPKYQGKPYNGVANAHEDDTARSNSADNQPKLVEKAQNKNASLVRKPSKTVVDLEQALQTKKSQVKAVSPLNEFNRSSRIVGNTSPLNSGIRNRGQPINFSRLGDVSPRAKTYTRNNQQPSMIKPPPLPQPSPIERGLSSDTPTFEQARVQQMTIDKGTPNQVTVSQIRRRTVEYAAPPGSNSPDFKFNSLASTPKPSQELPNPNLNLGKVPSNIGVESQFQPQKRIVEQPHITSSIRNQGSALQSNTISYQAGMPNNSVIYSGVLQRKPTIISQLSNQRSVANQGLRDRNERYTFTKNSYGAPEFQPAYVPEVQKQVSFKKLESRSYQQLSNIKPVQSYMEEDARNKLDGLSSKIISRVSGDRTQAFNQQTQVVDYQNTRFTPEPISNSHIYQNRNSGPTTPTRMDLNASSKQDGRPVINTSGFSTQNHTNINSGHGRQSHSNHNQHLLRLDFGDEDQCKTQAMHRFDYIRHIKY